MSDEKDERCFVQNAQDDIAYFCFVSQPQYLYNKNKIGFQGVFFTMFHIMNAKLSVNFDIFNNLIWGRGGTPLTDSAYKDHKSDYSLVSKD